MDPFLIYPIIGASIVLISFVTMFFKADYSQDFEDFLWNGDMWCIFGVGLLLGIFWPIVVVAGIAVAPFYLAWKVNHTKAKLAKPETEPASSTKPEKAHVHPYAEFNEFF